jgi:hypothetical protein
VEGVVTDVVTRPTPFGVESRYTIAVERTLAGAASDQVTIALPGGRDHGLVQRFSGVPVWSAGDEVLVFVPRPGEAQPLTGVFTRAGDAVVDPIERPDPPTSVADVARRIEVEAGEADDDPVEAFGRTSAGTADQ